MVLTNYCLTNLRINFSDNQTIVRMLNGKEKKNSSLQNHKFFLPVHTLGISRNKGRETKIIGKMKR